MTTTSAALTCLAAALLVVDSRTGSGRLRSVAGPATDLPAPAVIRPIWIAVGAVALGAVAWAAGAGPGGILLGVVAGLTGGVAVRRLTARAAGDDDEAALAGAWELLAVCLQVGLPVAAAVSAAAERLTGSSGCRLRRVAGLLELGADPPAAWHGAQALPALAGFARAAGRAAGTGAALAQVARAECTRIRADLVDTAEARAQRAAVHITGPLGLCFLPAFLVLGIAPVVIGLTGDALARW